MKQKRFLELLSRKMANEASPEELTELAGLMSGDDSLADLYKSFCEKEPLTEDDKTKADQSFALHAIKMHLATENEEVLVPVEVGAVHKKRLFRPANVFLFLFLLAAGFGISQLLKTGGGDSSVSTIIEVPAGQRKKVALPDGSVVWLNAKSKLTYPSEFNGTTREVELEGEALFDVTHNPQKPFTVVTPSYRINVLGTVFNVKSYSVADVFETTLVSGSVKVQEKDNASVIAVLKPNEKFSFDKKKAATSVTKVDAPTYTTWKDGLYQFDHVSFGEMLNDLQLYKDVKIQVVDSSLLSIICTGKFRQQESIEQIMDILKTDIPFRYTYDADTKLLRLLPAR